VPDDQLTNAIGRKGQNVKLAAKLLGWKIDIYTETRYQEANSIGQGLEQLASVAEVPMEAFLSAGFTTVESIREADDEALLAVSGLTSSKISDVRAAINFLGMPAADATPEEEEKKAPAKEDA
jgi:N utilization substance protein A